MNLNLNSIKMKHLVGMALVFTSVIFVTIQGCKHYPEPLPIPTTNSQDTTSGGQDSTRPCDPDSVYFENTILPLLSSSCAYSGCHDAASHEDDVILDSYTNIFSTGEIKPGDPSDSKLYKVITESGGDVMPPPPNSPLTPAQISLINKWITQGALNNRCDECDSSDVKYSNQVLSILNNNCVSCHNGSSASGGVHLDSYAGVKAQADNGKLFGVINHSSGFKIMPPSGNKISDCNVRIIKKWIDDGAPNN